MLAEERCSGVVNLESLCRSEAWCEEDFLFQTGLLLPILSTRVTLSQIPLLNTWFIFHQCFHLFLVLHLLFFVLPSGFVLIFVLFSPLSCHWSVTVPIVFTCLRLTDEFVCLCPGLPLSSPVFPTSWFLMYFSLDTWLGYYCCADITSILILGVCDFLLAVDSGYDSWFANSKAHTEYVCLCLASFSCTLHLHPMSLSDFETCFPTSSIIFSILNCACIACSTPSFSLPTLKKDVVICQAQTWGWSETYRIEPWIFASYKLMTW